MALSKKQIDRLKPNDKQYIVWDGDIPGFGVIVYPSWRKSYVIQFRDSYHKTRKHVIGHCGIVTLDDARNEARRCLALATLGNTSFLKTSLKGIVTLADVWSRYEREYAPNLKPRTRQENDRLWNVNIRDAIGSSPISGIQKRDVADLHIRHYEHPYLGNRILSLLSLLFGLTERWGLREDGTNPCLGIQRYKEKSRERYLSDSEVQAIERELATGGYHQSVVLAIRLLLLTGCRLSEILTLKWEYIDNDSNVIRLPDSKTGAKVIPISDAVNALLCNTAAMPGNPYVCWGEDGKPRIDIHKAWKRLCEACGLQVVRIHDLRHTFASTAISSGMNLIMVRDLLGHRNVATTQRYAHLHNDAIHEASEEVSGRIQSAMSRTATGTDGKVIQFPVDTKV